MLYAENLYICTEFFLLYIVSGGNDACVRNAQETVLFRSGDIIVPLFSFRQP